MIFHRKEISMHENMIFWYGANETLKHMRSPLFLPETNDMRYATGSDIIVYSRITSI